ncbi:monocarboxylate transporter 2-like isoform X2 [Eleginops maclovinus]|uniref:monocarboxylate transporter 2-like isoform X2 n=1 Tax=Eleginops maclovinus TaxID=56733 RepID=UPI0030805AB1
MDFLHYASCHVCRRTGEQHVGDTLWKSANSHSGWTDVWGIYGCGLSLNLNASLTIISKYFLVKRPLANGLAMAGSPVFLCLLAPVNQYLLQIYGWRGSLLILGGLMLNCCVAGALMRPVIAPCKTSNCEPQKKLKEQPNDSHTKLKEGCMKNAKSFLDLTFFKDRGFVIYLIGSIMFIFGAYAPIVFLSAYAIRQGVEEFSAAYLLTIMGFVDMFVRPATGLIASSKWVRPRIQFFFSFAMVFTGTVHLLCPLFESYTFLVTYAVFFGVGFGMVFALIFECLMDLMGNERFPSAVGLVTIIECFPMLLGPPTAGLLVDIFGDYKYLFFMCGSVILSGGLFLFVMNIYNYHMLEKEKPGMDREKKQINVESQAHLTASEVEMKRNPEAEMERSEPEAKEANGVQREPQPENAETPD